MVSRLEHACIGEQVAHYVSPQSLKAWAEKKGLNPFAVAKSIAKKGTKANPFFQTAVGSVEDRVNQEFDKALENITQELAGN